MPSSKWTRPRRAEGPETDYEREKGEGEDGEELSWRWEVLGS